jgi:hypothetical protein
MRRAILATLCLVGMHHSPAGLWADDAEAIARGKKAMESRAFVPATWPESAYDDLWKQWQPRPQKAPDDYDRAVREHYGMPRAPFDNGRYPFGFRKAADGNGVAIDCLLCHGGAVLGTSYVGLGNASIDLQTLFEDMERAAGRSGKLPHVYANVRGTTEAFAMSMFLLSLRHPDLSLRLEEGKLKPAAWEIRDNLCEDAPAWWLLKKKKTMYHTGFANARSTRALMQFLLDPGNAREVFDREEAVFRDILAYFVSLEAPKYPFAIDRKLAAAGQEIFTENCAQCHGTYGAKWTYPSKIVEIDKIGVDRTRYLGVSAKFRDAYNGGWFGQEKPQGFGITETAGHQAPPLDGVWATAPYLHNGSLPTLYDVLNSKTRPKLFTRSYKTDENAYDKAKVGWKVDVLTQSPQGLGGYEQRKIYDTTLPGRGNAGHTFGDDLTDDERRAVIEYLKTL